MTIDRDSWRRATLKLKDENDTKFNEGIEAALKVSDNLPGLFTTYLGHKTFKNELEKLKKPI